MKRSSGSRASLATPPLAEIVIDLADGRVVKANPTAATLWEMPQDSLCGHDLEQLIDPTAWSAFSRWVAEGAQSTLAHPVRPFLPARGCSTPWPSWQFEASRVPGEDRCRCQIERTDGNQEAEIRRLNWALAAHVRSSKALIHAGSLQEMAESVCSAIVENDDYVLAAIFLGDETSSKTLRPVARAGRATNYLQGLELSWDESRTSGQGPTGRAIRSGEPVVMADSQRDPNFEPWRAQAKRHRIRSSVTIPFAAESGTLGAILVYASRPKAFSTREMEVFSSLGQELGFVMDVLRDRERLKSEFEARLAATHALRSKQAELERVARALTVSEFAASLAHELNQPLTAIVNYCQIALQRLRENSLDVDAATAATREAMEAARRAGTIVKRTRSLLAHGEFMAERCDLNDVLREALAFVRADFEQRNIAVQLRLQERLPRIMASPVQLQQVVLNLLVNARDALDAMPRNDRKILVETQLEGGFVELLVSDNGPGMSDETRERLFDPLYSTKHGGMGMGLSISRTIVEAHDGRLWADPGSPRGTDFRVAIPVERAAAA